MTNDEERKTKDLHREILLNTPSTKRDMGYFSTLKTVLFSPLDMPEQILSEEGYLHATLFSLLSCLLSLLFFLIAGTIATLVTGSWHIIAVIGIFSAVNLIVLPISVHFMALLYHLSCKLLGGVGEYSETFRAVAYGYGPLATTIVPLFHLAAGTWILILHGIFLKEVHDLSDLRAILAVLLVVFVQLVIGMIAATIFIIMYRKEVLI